MPLQHLTTRLNFEQLWYKVIKIEIVYLHTEC